MATSDITGKITNPAGTALVNVPVKVVLYPRPAFDSATDAELAATYETVTDSNGEYVFTLQETAGITPDDSFYVITEYIPPRYGGAIKHVIQVGAGNATVLASKVGTPPSPATAVFLTQAAADARYVTSPGTFGGAGDIEPITPDDAADAGALDEYARIDHQHAAPAAAPADLTLTATESEGVSTSFARADHVHGTDRLPWGIIGYETTTSDPSTFSAITDLPGATITFTAIANRQYKITASALFVIAANTCQVSMSVRTGGDVQIQAVVSDVVAASGVGSCHLEVVVAPGAGSITYKLTAARQSGTGTLTTSINAERPDFILIEDIGPVT